MSESGFAAHRSKQDGQRWKGRRLRALIAQSFEQSRTPTASARAARSARVGQRCGKNRLPDLCGRVACAPGRSAVFGLAPPRVAIITRSRKLAGKVPAPDRPGQLWQSDITYIETQEGWLYLAFTLDSCSRRCIAHVCRQDMLGELTTTTFKHAVTRQRPLVGLIHHSDRGSQYAAELFSIA